MSVAGHRSSGLRKDLPTAARMVRLSGRHTRWLSDRNRDVSVRSVLGLSMEIEPVRSDAMAWKVYGGARCTRTAGCAS